MWSFSQICSHVDIHCIVSFVLKFDSLLQTNTQAIKPPITAAPTAAAITPTSLFLRNGWILVVSVEIGMLHYVGTTKLNEAVLAIILTLYLSLAAVRCYLVHLLQIGKLVSNASNISRCYICIYSDYYCTLF